jgi:cell wall-associated NlpC family hydrolase
MAPTSENLATVASSLLGLPYGWGGLFENRDCSSAIRDLFMPFGLWLPRNSREQAVAGSVTKLSNLGEDQKAQLILEEAVPFATLLQKKGHIALYVGHSDGYPVVLHSVWDLTVKRRKGETRKHFGRIVLSRLRPSSEDGPCGPGTTLLADLDSMTILLP